MQARGQDILAATLCCEAEIEAVLGRRVAQEREQAELEAEERLLKKCGKLDAMQQNIEQRMRVGSTRLSCI